MILDFSNLEKLNCREMPSPILEYFLTPHGFSGRNFVRGVIMHFNGPKLALYGC